MTDPREAPAGHDLGSAEWTDLSEADRHHLRRAIRLGREGWGSVHPNPMVGCVLVRNGSVVAEGVHRSFGGPHAEADALARAGSEAKGATAYVSLEPCRHQGKTPPCAPALHAAGIARVVFWAPDPGPEEGGGGRWLEEQGVRVQGPYGSEEEWRGENPFFFHRPHRNRPYVAVKLAVSLDGGIAPAGGRRQWLTGPEARGEVHRLRAGFDAILVGAGTWRADDPELTVREWTQPATPPLRVFIDPRGDMASTAAAFQGDGGPVVLAVGEAVVDAAATRLGSRAQVFGLPPGPGGLDMPCLLDLLGRRGVRTLLCEGGGRLAATLLAGGLADRLYFFQAPLFLGSRRVSA
ncbi:MAG: bifunctional diaminohydroxyphosphoribosylaminopyrimidine deaminase/5-amino-6-(5-phosphoribosylamino)uracil reductase RibD, partial [Gemmatimonadota bacterium]|nr:bifunctional diaminohydroxyphosphoribosylaminopyrimidine deaminase/5-amino-6-(5-phosphoribosylamino)uracil reductase RibD [Gemmatimonadota bacterium]